jgi:hypothetical protein
MNTKMHQTIIPPAPAAKAASTKDAARTSLQNASLQSAPHPTMSNNTTTVRRRSGRPQQTATQPQQIRLSTPTKPAETSQQLTTAAQHHRASWRGF